MTDWKEGLHPRHAERYDSDPEYAAWVRRTRMKQRAIKGHMAIMSRRNDMRLVMGLLTVVAAGLFYLSL